jgi:hypothetical protein
MTSPPRRTFITAASASFIPTTDLGWSSVATELVYSRCPGSCRLAAKRKSAGSSQWHTVGGERQNATQPPDLKVQIARAIYTCLERLDADVGSRLGHRIGRCDFSVSLTRLASSASSLCGQLLDALTAGILPAMTRRHEPCYFTSARNFGVGSAPMSACLDSNAAAPGVPVAAPRIIRD